MSRKVDIKICGLTNLDDTRAAQEAGADFLGFVLYRRSARYIAPRTLRRLLEHMTGDPETVGVFVNETRASVLKIARDCGLAIVQLHGDESADDWPPMAAPIWRALRVHGGKVSPVPGRWPAARYILDAAVPGRYGGTGTRADWKQAAELARRYPIMLAGGLTPDNVAEAIRRVRPLGVDVASGVEKAAGKKDNRKLKAFIRAVRNAQIGG